MTTPHQNQNHDHDNITLNLSLKGAPQYLAQRIEKGIASGTHVFKIRISRETKGMFPSVCAPIAGIIEYYRTHEQCDFFLSRGMARKHSYLSHIGLLDPLTRSNKPLNNSYLDTIWRFDTNTQYDIASGIIDSIRSSAPLTQDLLNCLELCLTEITDNALNHSTACAYDEEACGFVMAQVHHETRRVAIAVFDYGMGIYESLKQSRSDITSKADAISAALRKGITDGRGAGKGLWILDQIVRNNEGSFEITSAGSRYSLRHLDAKEDAIVVRSSPNEIIPGTTLIDFQLNISNQTSISDVIADYQFVDLWMEHHEEDDTGSSIILAVKKEARGLGSRKDARGFANIVYNAATTKAPTIKIDFSDIEIVSSSFADELMRQLIQLLGFTRFVKTISLIKMSRDTERIINEAMQSRMETI